MKTIRYFVEQVLRKRPYIDMVWLPEIIDRPIRRFVQSDGRVRLWGFVVDPRDGKTRVLRLVILEDCETVHNAFFDRNFQDIEP